MSLSDKDFDVVVKVVDDNAVVLLNVISKIQKVFNCSHKKAWDLFCSVFKDADFQYLILGHIALDFDNLGKCHYEKFNK